MIKTGLLLVFVICGSAISVFAKSDSDFLSDKVKYLWPTNASNYISSTFGETRAQHFHSAIDIGTWGHEGYPVFASRDGILYRAGVTPRGYGNVVYLQHSDGSFTVYAHLKDFAPEIREVVDSLRFKDYSFVFNRRLDDTGIKFNQGDIIGWSGSTGVGPPHLHFEVRTPDNIPVNPLLTNISVEDNIPPRFSGLAIEPLSPHTLVNGKREIKRKRAEFNGDYFDFGTIEITGPAGLAINAMDRADGSNNIHAVYELELWVDGQKFFHSRADSFHFSQSRQMFIDRVYPTLRDTRRGYQRLYLVAGNSLPFYQPTGYNGILDMEDGTYTVTIVARDFAGNSAEARGSVIVDRQVPNSPAHHITGHHDISVPEGGSSDLTDWYWHKNWLAPDSTNKSIKAARIGSFRNQLMANSAGPSRQGFRLDPVKSMELKTPLSAQRVHRIIPGRETTIRTSDHVLSARFNEHSVFDTLSVALYHNLEAESPYIKIFPDSEPLAAPVTVSLLLSEELRDKENLALYERNPRNGNLSRVPGSRHLSGLDVAINKFGKFYIKQDTIPPVVTSPEIYRRSDGKWFAAVTVEDERSGIDYGKTRFYINERQGIAEYDPEKDKLIYHHPEFSPTSGEYELKVVVPDKSENIARKTFKIQR